MSWLIELRNNKDNATEFYKLLCENAAAFSAINRLWPHEIIRTRPQIFMFDMLAVRKEILVKHIQEQFPHIWWVRENLTPDKVALIFTSTENPLASKLASTDQASSAQGFYLQGFLFVDPADAVTFKLMWSAELA